MFLALIRGRTLARAAQALAVDASTVQRRIGRLEAALGTKLFDRKQQGYALTPGGEELRAHASVIEAEVATAIRKVAGRDERLDGVVRVTTVDDLALTVLMPLIGSFRRAHPAVTVELFASSEFADLGRRQADVALRFGARPVEPDVVAKHVTRIPVALFASRDYLARRRAPRTERDLAAHEVVIGDAHMERVPMERWLSERSDPTRVAFRSRSMLLRSRAVVEGLGIGFLPEFMARGEPSLVRFPLVSPDLSTGLWLLSHVDLRTNARVRAFVDHLYAGLVAQADRFAGSAERARAVTAKRARGAARERA